MTPLRSSLLVLVGALLWFGCDAASEPPDPPTINRHADLGPSSTLVSGYLFDPEAYLWALMSHPGDNPPDPIWLVGVPYAERSALRGGVVSVVDPLGGNEPVSARAPTEVDGLWYGATVPSRADKPLFIEANPSEQGVVVADAELRERYPVEEGFYPVPAGKYFPTRNYAPFLATENDCLLQQGVMIGDQGSLAALANYFTSSGVPTEPADLLDPSKDQTILLVYAMGPTLYPVDFYIDAQILLSADQGIVYHFDFGPPGNGPPHQSPMGFYVGEAGYSSIGYAAVVLPGAPPPTVKLNLFSYDHSFSDLEVPIVPGKVNWVRAIANHPDGPQPIGGPNETDDLSWLCVPPPPPAAE